MKPYNGHRSYNAWNIALWMGNDEGIYRFAVDCLRRKTLKGKTPNLKQATNRFMGSFDGDKTPDGVLYTRTNVKLALAGFKE